MAKKKSKSPPRPATGQFRILRLVVLAALVGYLFYRGQQIADPPDQPPPGGDVVEIGREPQTRLPHEEDESKTIRRVVLFNQEIRDEDGKVVYRGNVDLSRTLERIRADRPLMKYSHDGEIFENREHRLPGKPADYYRAWVHPTPELSGPGPQRVVAGQKGELFYSPDHYRSFQRVDR